MGKLWNEKIPEFEDKTLGRILIDMVKQLDQHSRFLGLQAQETSFQELQLHGKDLKQRLLYVNNRVNDAVRAHTEVIKRVNEIMDEEKRIRESLQERDQRCEGKLFLGSVVEILFNLHQN